MTKQVIIDFDRFDEWKSSSGIETDAEICRTAGLHAAAIKQLRTGYRQLSIKVVTGLYEGYGVKFDPKDPKSFYRYNDN
jgi:hypothetical protein